MDNSSLTVKTFIDINSNYHSAELLSDFDIIYNYRRTQHIYLNRPKLIDKYSFHIKHGYTIIYNEKIPTDCLICFENIQKDNEVYNLPCGTTDRPHIFHKNCFNKWNQKTCPYCRQII